MPYVTPLMLRQVKASLEDKAEDGGRIDSKAHLYPVRKRLLYRTIAASSVDRHALIFLNKCLQLKKAMGIDLPGEQHFLPRKHLPLIAKDGN